MDEALAYLSKYLAEPRILSAPEIDDSLLAELPEWWRGALLGGGGATVRRTLQAWETERDHLPRVFDFLSAHLKDVRLLKDRTSVRLLYRLEKGSRTMYYAGGNPLRKSMKPSVQQVWHKLPADFRRFYDSFHDGWYYLASNSLGPSPTEDFFILDELEWGLLDEIPDPGCDLRDLLAVYTNGMGAYVAISIERSGPWGDVLWWKNKPPRLNIDAWAAMDAWTEIGLNK